MIPVKFDGMNVTYVATDCEDLPTLVVTDGENIKTVTSVWNPSAEDLELLNNGGCVCLSVYGGQPPVALWTQEVNIVE